MMRQFILNNYRNFYSLMQHDCLVPGAYIYLNPFNYFFLRRQVYSPDVFYRTDGLFVTTLVKFVLRKRSTVVRQSMDFTSLAPLLFEICSSRSYSVFISGAKSDELDTFLELVHQKYPTLGIVGSVDGYVAFDILENEIRQTQPDIVLLGLGNIKQEDAALRLKTLFPSMCFFTCGAFISQVGSHSKLSFYPDFVNNINIRWLYRFFTEPRVISRVFRYYPVFLFVFFFDLLRGMKP